MNHTRDEIHRVVVESLKEVLGKTELDVHDKTDPIRDLGLESADGLDFACILSQRLGCNIPDAVNPFVNDDEHRARRLREIVDLICMLGALNQEVRHG